MSEGDSNRMYPTVYPSLDGLPHSDDSINFASGNPMPTPMPRGNTPVHSQLGSLGGPANPTRQTNPLHYPAENTSPSSNFMATPIHMGNQHQPAPIVAIGNPGSGKSTILNALAGQVLFGSGISLGCGLTSQLDKKEVNGRTFIDTPGVADDTYQKAAEEALTKVFHQGGSMKILFFVSQEEGRIVAQDVTTMRLILNSVPEIGKNYGIIVNRIPIDVLSQLSEGESFLRFLLSLYAGIEDRFKNKNTLLLPWNNKLNSKNNALLPPSEIHPDLENFINTNMPVAYITPGQITEIQLDDFEQLNKQVQGLESELQNQERQKAETEKLLAHFENIEKEKIKEHEETLKKDEEELQKMKKSIRDKEEEMTDTKQRSETEMRSIQQRSEIEKRDLKQMEQGINDQHNQIKKKRIAAHQRKSMGNSYKAWNLLDLFGTDFGLQNAAGNTMRTGRKM